MCDTVSINSVKSNCFKLKKNNHTLFRFGTFSGNSKSECIQKFDVVRQESMHDAMIIPYFPEEIPQAGEKCLIHNCQRTK